MRHVYAAVYAGGSVVGDIFKQQYKRKDGRGGKSRKWNRRIRQDDGKWKAIPLCKDAQAARSMLRDLERKAERRKAGDPDPFDESRRVPVDEFVAQYLRHMKHLKGDGDRHVDDTARSLRRVRKDCGFESLGKLDAS